MENLSISKNTWIVKGFLHILLVVLTTCYLLLTAPAAHAGIKPPPSNLGLVGYWSMDDCRSTKATDFSGSGNTGSLSGFSYTGSTSNWVSGSAAKRGCALNFDGSNDYVASVGTVDSYSFIQNTDIFTLSAWVYRTSNGAATIMGNTGTSVEKGFYWILNSASAGDISVAVLNGDGNPTGKVFTSIGGLVPLNVWTHIVVTENTTDNMKFYINGVMATSNPVTVTSTGSSSRLLDIGRYNWSTPGSYFNGSLDEVRIYNRALSAGDVLKLYNAYPHP